VPPPDCVVSTLVHQAVCVVFQVAAGMSGNCYQGNEWLGSEYSWWYCWRTRISDWLTLALIYTWHVIRPNVTYILCYNVHITWSFRWYLHAAGPRSCIVMLQSAAFNFFGVCEPIIMQISSIAKW